MITVATATEEHARSIGLRLRAEDMREVDALGIDGPEGVLLSMRYSIMAFTMLDDGVPMGMWGACTDSLIASPAAIIWCLTAEGTERLAKHQLRLSRKFVEDMMVIYPRLLCYVDPEYTKTRRWVGWLGGELRGETVLGTKTFLRFEWGDHDGC
jgi:hypothetical protein